MRLASPVSPLRLACSAAEWRSGVTAARGSEHAVRNMQSEVTRWVGRMLPRYQTLRESESGGCRSARSPSPRPQAPSAGEAPSLLPLHAGCLYLTDLAGAARPASPAALRSYLGLHVLACR
ncbi:hypothetical protein MHYP_G00343170 [Metynnis hypsauchen]